MSEQEINSVGLNASIPKSKQLTRERLWRDMEAFLENGGRIKTEAGDVDPEEEVTSVQFAAILDTNSVAIQTGLRSGRLFGVPFPAPKRYDGKVPLYRMGDAIEFYRRTRQ